MSDILIMITTTLANYSFKLRQSPYEILKHCFYLAHPLSIICKVFYNEKKKIRNEHSEVIGINQSIEITIF